MHCFLFLSVLFSDNGWKMFKVFLTYVLPILLSTCCTGDVTYPRNIFQHRAYHMSDLDNYIFDGDYILEEFQGIQSKFECTLLCGQNKSCIAFSHHREEERCLQYAVGVFPYSESKPDVGWSFYIFGEVTCPIEDGFINLRKNNLCLYWSPRKMNYDSAKQLCRSKMSNVISLDSPEKFAAVREVLSPLQTPVYIGLTRVDNVWVWENGRFAHSIPWQTGQPVYHGGSENCAVANGHVRWKFVNTPCGYNTNVVCELI